MRETNWEALADIQFVIYKRVADSLNAALSAVALSDMPDAGQSPLYWRQRANTKIANVLNLFTAWEYLIRYKMGETIPDRAILPFHVNTLLAWLAQQLQLATTPTVEGNPQLHANQETLQEALMLLYSAAFTQGTNVRLEMESNRRGMWFRIKFARNRPLPLTFDALLESFGAHWRARDAYFELSTARDFVRLNGSELLLHSSDHHGEFAFFVWRAGVKRDAAFDQATQRQADATLLGHTTQVISETDLPDKPITKEFKPFDATPVLPPPSHIFPPDDTVPSRPADRRPTHFPLPDTAFSPDPAVPESHKPEQGDATPSRDSDETQSALPVPAAGAVGGQSPPAQHVTLPHRIDNTPVVPLSTPRPAGARGAPPVPDLGAGGGSSPAPQRVTLSHLSNDTPVIRLTASRPVVVRSQGTVTPVLPPETHPAGSSQRRPEKPRSGAIIVAANIPRPVLPASLHRPPATTSTVALTNDPQSRIAPKPAPHAPTGGEQTTPPHGPAEAGPGTGFSGESDTP